MPIWRMVVFLAIIVGLDAAIHYYLWLRLVRDPGWSAPWTTIGSVVMAVLAASIPAAFFTSRSVPPAVAAPIAWFAFVWMGVMFFLLVILLPAELVRLGAWWTGRGLDEVAQPERRRLVARTIAIGAAAVSGALGGFSMWYALRPVDVLNVRVPLRSLPAALRGFSIAQLTDVHVGPTIGRELIEQLVEKTNRLAPDMIAITGDLVDGSVAELRHAVAPLANLRARHGVFFVTGNHEYYSGAEEWVLHLRSLGIRVLQNERVTIEHDGAQIDIAGVNDWTAGQFAEAPDLARALRDRPDDRKVVLLAHQPKQIDEASAKGVDLQISGHTHGGQIMPFNFLVRLQQPYVAGLHDHAGCKLYVSSGTGFWGPPMRLGVPAEITRLELA
jgi:predicted MPP superfamily phosphohydrolase